MTDNTQVRCNGCRQCCINFPAIILYPEAGDDVSAYKTVDVQHPLTGEPAKMLAHKANGDCEYIGPHGCDIYDNRPIICREFDCRKMYLSFPKPMREYMVKRGMADKETFEAGKQRQHSLNAQERLVEIAKRKARV